MLVRKENPAKRKPGEKVQRGTGAGEYKVKGHRATAKQRAVIDGVLEQAQDDNASRRVMIAAVMCVTQESGAGELANVMTGNDDVGIYQQGRNWISVEGSKDPKKSTHAFLITGPTSWKKVHGSVKKAPGNLSQAIHAVQGNRDPNAYAAWEDEATDTVEAWLESGGSEGGGSYPKRYTFTRGEKGGSREDSWAASERLVGEVGAYRWAAANVFYAVSGDELRQGRPALMIMGDEGWLRRGPAWTWSSNRAITEVTLEALADRWDILPGAIVTLHRRFGAMQGKWMVWNVAGSSLVSPEVTIVLRRPTRLKSEPPHETASRGGDDGGGGDASKLEDICKEISENRSSYDYGGSHGTPLKSIKSSDHMDCSSAVSLALYRAGFMGDRKMPITSGQFASSWGKPGKGDEFTVYANGGHVFLEGPDGEWRFDTGYHPPPSGPAYTKTKRSDHGRFTAKRWPGH
jgi:hypothetical protein